MCATILHVDINNLSTALNLLGRLCGIATATRDVVARLQGLPTRVACTRKTTPGLRALEKYAVRAGGGSNHRFGLDDAVLVKDNHRLLAGGVRESVARCRAAAGHMVEQRRGGGHRDTLARQPGRTEYALAAGRVATYRPRYTRKEVVR